MRKNIPSSSDRLPQAWQSNSELLQLFRFLTYYNFQFHAQENVQLLRPNRENRAIRESPLEPINLLLTTTNRGANEGKTQFKNSPNLGRKEKSAFKP